MESLGDVFWTMNVRISFGNAITELREDIMEVKQHPAKFDRLAFGGLLYYLRILRTMQRVAMCVNGWESHLGETNCHYIQ